jgi:hypothetical protein
VRYDEHPDYELPIDEPVPHRHVHAGQCQDIDGCSWHQDGDRCDCCGFGVDLDRGEPVGTKIVTAYECRLRAGTGGER